MLSFEHKKSIFRSFKELQESPISNNRMDYVYPNSLQKGKMLATQLHPSGNGYVIGKYMDPETILKKGYKVDKQGWIKIKDFSQEELNEIILNAMISMSGKKTRNVSNMLDNKQNRIEVKIEQENVIPNSNFENLVRSCLYNWLGYGNINAPIWFMGIEEGGAEIWRNKTITLNQSLEFRSKFSNQMDFRYVWENIYNISLESFSGPNVWRYMVAFLLEWEGRSSSPIDIQNYIFKSKQLGREDSNHFLGELMPLPKISKGSMKPYKSIWTSSHQYYEEVGVKRFSIIRDTIERNQNVRIIVSYDKVLTEKFLNYFSTEIIDDWLYERERYMLYKIMITDNRIILLLSTPFFGNGRISYDGLRDSARRVLNVIE